MFKKINVEEITNNFGFARKAKTMKEIDLEILYLSRTIGSLDSGDEAYQTALKDLETLVKIKNESKKGSGLNSGDVLKFAGAGLTAGASILGIMMVLKYESSDEIITSKSFSLASKLLGK